MFIAGFDGICLNSKLEKLIVSSGIGGLILFERNFKDPDQLIKLISELQSLAMSSASVPLFISVDQEGGRVARLIGLDLQNYAQIKLAHQYLNSQSIFPISN